jgi:hypothetical protein
MIAMKPPVGQSAGEGRKKATGDETKQHEH